MASPLAAFRIIPAAPQTGSEAGSVHAAVETRTCFIFSSDKKFDGVVEKRTFTFLQDLDRVSNFQWEAVLDRPSEAGQN